MIWHLIENNENTGRFNMELDVELARSCKSDEAYFRLYRWKPFAISLGANQNEAEIDIQLAGNDGIDVVKRPTGGRAILHAEEVTYSVIIPVTHNSSSKEIYNKISMALINGLRKYDENLAGLELEDIQPHFPSLLKQPSGMICFASTARHEVKYKGKKIIGSAQRKMNNVILQHGSILCGDYHLNLPKYLKVDSKQKSVLQKEMNAKTISLGNILDKEILYPKLYKCLIEGFSETWNVEFNIHNAETLTYH